jgi:hypothetical protein
MFEVFKITSYTGPSDGRDLLGLLVIQTNQGYFLVDPEPSLKTPRVLSSVLMINLEKPLGSFHFHHKKLPWTLNIDTILPTEISGTWFPGDGSAQREGGYMDVEDNWTATGTGTGVPDDNEAHAASAK